MNINEYGLNLYTKEIVNGEEVFKPVFWRDLKIRNYSIDEILSILSQLDVERIYDMKLTMSNLELWRKILEEEMNKSIQMAFKKAVDEITGDENE